MNIILHRTEESANGIFGVMTDEFGNQVCATIEHSFDSGLGNGSFSPKIPPGQYTCVRGMHQLAHMTHPFETFMVENVPNHTNILIHMGNYNADSDGCILVGEARIGNMITNSLVWLAKFLDLQKGLDSFILTVE